MNACVNRLTREEKDRLKLWSAEGYPALIGNGMTTETLDEPPEKADPVDRLCRIPLREIRSHADIVRCEIAYPEQDERWPLTREPIETRTTVRVDEITSPLFLSVIYSPVKELSTLQAIRTPVSYDTNTWNHLLLDREMNDTETFRSEPYTLTIEMPNTNHHVDLGMTLILLEGFSNLLNVHTTQLIVPDSGGYSNLIVRRIPGTIRSFSFAGDVMLERYVSKHILSGKDPFEDVKEILRESSIAFINLETSVGSNGTEVSSKAYTFQTPPERLIYITNAGIDVVSLANNHAMDYGDEGMEETLAFLDLYGIDHTGAGMDYEEAVIPVIYSNEMITVCVLAFGDIYPTSLYADDDEPGIAMLEEEGVLAEIEKWKDSADILIISLHTGIEYQDTPTSGQKDFAHDFIDAGADLVIMHHPHEIQGMELYNDRMIFYSLGNFIFDQRSGETRMSMIGEWSIDLRYDTEMNPVYSARYSVIPIMKSYSTYYPELAEGDDLVEVTNRLLTLSQKLNDKTMIFIKDDTYEYERFIIGFTEE